MQLQELRRLEATTALLGDRLERLLVALTLTLDLHREAERRLIASGGVERNAPGTSPADVARLGRALAVLREQHDDAGAPRRDGGSRAGQPQR